MTAKVDKPGYDRLHLQLGRQVYTQQCAGCHGTTGDGKGPAGSYLNPPPRDYRNGVFKFTSTPRGSKPRREDLRRILKYGAKGTSMPAFRFLSDEETEAVIDYVQVLSARGELEINLIREATDELNEHDDFDPETVAEFVTDISKSWDRADGELIMPLTVNPPRTAETVHDGAVAFAELSCVKCHNRDAAGSRSADVGVDIWGRTAYPANLAGTSSGHLATTPPASRWRPPGGCIRPSRRRRWWPRACLSSPTRCGLDPRRRADDRVAAADAVRRARRGRVLGTMVAFGLGTVPAMVATGFGGSLLGIAARRHLHTIAAWCLVLTGLVSIARGAGYLSFGGAEPAGCPLCAPDETAP